MIACGECTMCKLNKPNQCIRILLSKANEGLPTKTLSKLAEDIQVRESLKNYIESLDE